MSFQDNTEEADLITNQQTDETSETEFQETLASESHYEDAELTPQAKAIKEKRIEENRLARESLKNLPQIVAELEKQKFFKSMPEAEDYEKEIDEFRAKIP